MAFGWFLGAVQSDNVSKVEKLFYHLQAAYNQSSDEELYHAVNNQEKDVHFIPNHQHDNKEIENLTV